MFMQETFDVAWYKRRVAPVRFWELGNMEEWGMKLQGHDVDTESKRVVGRFLPSQGYKKRKMSKRRK